MMAGQGVSCCQPAAGPDTTADRPTLATAGQPPHFIDVQDRERNSSANSTLLGTGTIPELEPSRGSSPSPAALVGPWRAANSLPACQRGHRLWYMIAPARSARVGHQIFSLWTLPILRQ